MCRLVCIKTHGVCGFSTPLHNFVVTAHLSPLGTIANLYHWPQTSLSTTVLIMPMGHLPSRFMEVSGVLWTTNDERCLILILFCPLLTILHIFLLSQTSSRVPSLLYGVQYITPCCRLFPSKSIYPNMKMGPLGGNQAMRAELSRWDSCLQKKRHERPLLSAMLSEN